MKDIIIALGKLSLNEMKLIKKYLEIQIHIHETILKKEALTNDTNSN